MQVGQKVKILRANNAKVTRVVGMIGRVMDVDNASGMIRLQLVDGVEYLADRYSLKPFTSIDIEYMVGKKLHSFTWEVEGDFTAAHAAGFTEAKRRHKSARKIVWMRTRSV
jgi:hypothetical protein